MLTFSAYAFDNESIIRVGIHTDFPPYMHKNEGKIEGFAIDYIKELAKEYNLNLQYIEYESWDDIFEASANNLIDVIPNLGITTERKKLFIFSDPYEAFHITAYTRSNTSPKKNFTDYKADRVGVMVKNVAGKIARKNNFENIKEYANINELIFALISTDVDMIIAPEPVALKAEKKLNINDKIDTAFDNLAEIKRGLAVNNQNADLASFIIPKANKFSKSEAYKRLYLRWFANPDFLIEHRRITYALLIILPLVSVIVIFSMVYIRIRETRKFTSRLQKKIFELTHTKNALKLSNQYLEEANKELESFAYTVSHDLRAPLRHITGFTNMLEKEIKEPLSEKGEHCLDAIKKSSAKLGLLIDDLLKFSRLNQATINYETFDPKEIIESTVNGYSEEPEYSHIKFNIQVKSSLYGDVSLLRVVIDNLISNAIKYSAIKEDAEITIKTYEDNDENIIEIYDNGIGFDMEYVDKIFGVFERLNNSSDYSGTGIGLATVKRIINRHKGRIEAFGEIDKGARFLVHLKNKET